MQVVLGDQRLRETTPTEIQADRGLRWQPHHLSRVQWANPLLTQNQLIQRTIRRIPGLTLRRPTWKRTWTLIFGTWNVRAINGKELELTEEMDRYKIDVLAVTETKKKGQGVENVGPNHILIFSGVNEKDRAKAGVGLLIHKSQEKLVESWNFISPRILEVNIKTKGRDIKLLVAYGPNEDANKDEKDIFENDLQLAAEKLNNKQELMVLGDLNARVGNNIETAGGVIGKEGETTISPNGERLIDFCLKNNMKIANTFFPHKNIHKYTRVNDERNEKSIIDYAIVSSSLFYSTMDIKVNRGAEIFSDHHLLIAKMRLLTEESKQKGKQKRTTKPKIEELKKPEVKQMYQDRIKRFITEKQIEVSNNTIEINWQLYKEALTSCMDEVCGRKLIKGNGKRTAWWNENVKAKVKEKKDAWRKYLKTKRPEDRLDYVNKRTIAKEEVKKAKQEQWEEFGHKLQESYMGNKKLFWGAMKSMRKTKSCPIRQIRNDKGEIMKEENEITETWREYFQQLHNTTRSYETRNTNQVTGALNQAELDEDTNISMEELQAAIRKIKIGKAPGADQIYPEMIKNQGIEADKILLSICQEAWKSKKVPDDWKKGIIVPIHKKGSTMDCSNYRGISLLSIPGKVYARILESKLRKVVENKIEEHQSGFRPGRSVQDHIFTVRQIAEKFIEKNIDLHLCFIDLEKAFDTVKRDELWQALKEHSVNQNLINAIQSFYDKPKCSVRVAGNLSKEFDVNIGVRQGCILSPLLFIIFMNSVTKSSKMNKMNVGMWKLRPVNIAMLSFADDLVLFGKSEKDLQHNINILNNELTKRGMRINAKKTKTMLVSKESKVQNLKLGRENLEQVQNYNYLGVMINCEGKLRDEISQRIKKAMTVYNQLGKAFTSKQELSVKTKMAVFDTVFCPTLLYGCETWTLDSREHSRLQATEMKYLRRVVGKTKRDRIRNTSIRDQTKTKGIKTKIRIKQLRWFDM